MPTSSHGLRRAVLTCHMQWLWVAKAEQEVSQSEKGAEAAIEEANKYCGLLFSMIGSRC